MAPDQWKACFLARDDLTPADTRLAAEIIELHDVAETVLSETVEHSGFLIIAVFGKKPAAGPEDLSNVSTQMSDRVHTIDTGTESRHWLETHITLVQMRIVRCNIRRVTDDEIETLVTQLFYPVAL